MKTLMVVAVAGIVLMLSAPGASPAAPGQTSGPERPAVGPSPVAPLLLAAVSTNEAAGLPYSAARVYPGEYGASMLFYRNPGSPYWKKVSDEYASFVICPEAHRRLQQTGVWQGHLAPNGACGPRSEPSEWAIGNWLNYEEAQQAAQE